MSDQSYPDAEFAKTAVRVAEEILFNLEKKEARERQAAGVSFADFCVGELFRGIPVTKSKCA